VKTKPLYFIAALITALVAGGCATKEKAPPEAQPDWITGESARFPASFYLTGQATGQTLEAAKQGARAELAKTFEVQIDATARDVQIVERVDELTSTQLLAERYIETQTRQILSGVEVVDTWHDPDNKQYHALVALDREKSARAMREDIRQLDELTAYNIEKAQEETDRLRLAAHAYKAYTAQLERGLIQRKLRIIDPGGTGIAPPVPLAKLKSDYEEVLGRVHIIAQSPDPDIQDMVAAGLAQSGFNADPQRPTQYVLKTTLETVPVIYREGFYWQQGAMNFQLLENTTAGKVRGSERWDLKVSATEEGLLEKRLKDELSQFNKNRYRDMILKFALQDAK